MRLCNFASRASITTKLFSRMSVIFTLFKITKQQRERKKNLNTTDYKSIFDAVFYTSVLSVINNSRALRKIKRRVGVRNLAKRRTTSS